MSRDDHTQQSEATGGAERYVVGLEPGADREIATDAAEEVERELDFGDTGAAVAGWYTARAVDRLAAHPAVRYVERDGDVRALDR